MKPLIAFMAISLFSAPLTLADAPPPELFRVKAEIEGNFKKEDAKLAALTSRYLSKLKPAEAEAFEKAQNTWLAWRETQAEFLAHRYAPTEASSKEIIELSFATITISMKISLTMSRIEELEGDLASR